MIRPKCLYVLISHEASRASPQKTNRSDLGNFPLSFRRWLGSAQHSLDEGIYHRCLCQSQALWASSKGEHH